jgi:hypothetical protein
VNPRRIATALRQIASALVGAADALEPPTTAGKVLTVEEAPEGSEFEEYHAPRSEMAKANEMIATMYLERALTRYSPKRPPSA